MKHRAKSVIRLTSRTFERRYYPRQKWRGYFKGGDIMYKGCTSCPYAGHIELKECPDAYTKVSRECRLFDRTEIPGSMPQDEFEAYCKKQNALKEVK